MIPSRRRRRSIDFSDLHPNVPVYKSPFVNRRNCVEAIIVGIYYWIRSIHSDDLHNGYAASIRSLITNDISQFDELLIFDQ
jgi:hypothetical protein